MMKYHTFMVSSLRTTPRRYPVGKFYWHLNDQSIRGDIVHRLATTMSPEEILSYWPNAFGLIETTDITLPVKRHPTGEEKSVVRFKFHYPEDQETSAAVMIKDTYSVKQPTKAEYAIWTCCAESLRHLLHHWPKAWNISVVAEGMSVSPSS